MSTHNRLFSESCKRKPSPNVIYARKKEEEKWEKLLLFSNKLHVNSEPNRNQKTGSTLESMGAILSSLPTPCYFQSFPKEKIKTSFCQRKFTQHEIPLKSLSKLVRSLQYNPIDVAHFRFSTSGIEQYNTISNAKRETV